MAAKSIILKEDLASFKSFSSESIKGVNEDSQSWSWLRQKLSLHLEHYLIDRLQRLDARRDVGLVSLGSWSRSELCPKSDIDVILTGEEASILKFVNAAESEGIYLKYRTPVSYTHLTLPTILLV